jgi:hypothetical protein
MAPNPYQPRFIDQEDLISFGLPDTTQQPDILTVVDRASTLIDEFCARADVDGQGSLAYTTYTERLFLPVGRNIFRVSFRPLAVVTPDVVAQLAASGSVSGEPNNYYTGVQPSPIVTMANVASPIVSCSGRYGYARRGQQQVYPDLNYAANVLQIASFFGGPPQFTNIDVQSIDFDKRTGECWVPAGLYLSQYTEVLIMYNSGFDPRAMPPAIKHATASLVRNLLARGGGATGLKSFQAGRIKADFTDELIDVNIQNLLQAYRTARAS